MGIRKPIVSEIAYRTWCIDEYGMDAMYLLEGSEKALLIDTGMATFDIPALVREFTQKPLVVAVTHCDIDHAGGMDQFGDVYMHPDDFEMARTMCSSPQGLRLKKDYIDRMLDLAEHIYDISADDLVVPEKRTVMHPMFEGDTIHLGGRDVEVYETPGHTSGGLSFLDRKERLLFTGDALNVNTLLGAARGRPFTEKNTISALLGTARKLDALQPYFDRNYNGHVGYAAAKGCLPVPEGAIRDCIALCEGVLAGGITPQKTVDPYCGDTGADRDGALIIKERECLEVHTDDIRIVFVPEQIR